jgi:hypothetical protein
MKIIIAIGALAITTLVILMALYFRKALFILAIPSMVTLLSAGAVFRHDHRFVWPLIGISVSAYCPFQCLFSLINQF